MLPAKKSFHFYISNTFLAIFLSVVSFRNSAQELLKTQTSWDGGKIEYPQGQAEITSHRLTITPQTDMPFHCHPVPTQGHILSGELLVETLAGKTTILKAGESVVEVMKTLHKGKALKGDVELVVFYAGAKDVPNTVLQDSPLSTQYCTP